jgi:TolA-binding protein
MSFGARVTSSSSPRVRCAFGRVGVCLWALAALAVVGDIAVLPAAAQPARTPAATLKPTPPKSAEDLAKAEKDRLANLKKALAESAAYWTELIKRYPESPRCEQAFYNLGVIYCECEQWKEAGEMLGKFVKGYPRSPLAGDAYIRLIDIALERMFDLKLAREHSDLGVGWAKGLAVASAGSEKPDSSKPREDGPRLAEAWRGPLPAPETVGTKPVCYGLYLRAGILAYLDQKREQAIEMFRAAEPFAAPEYSSVHGVVPTGTQRVIELAATGEKITPDDALQGDSRGRLVLQLADIYIEAGSRDKAAALCRKVIDPNQGLQASPTHRSYAMYRLSECHFKMFDFKTTHSLLVQAQAVAPKSSWADNCLHYIGNMLHNYLNDIPGAIAIWEKMLREYPDSDEADLAAFHIGLAYMWDRQWARGKDAFETFLQKYPNSPYVGIVRKVDIPRCERGMRGEKVEF